MAKVLLIAEKPDLMRKIQAVYNKIGFNDTIEFAAFVGHSMELFHPEDYDPDWKVWKKDTLPMLPKKFKYKPSNVPVYKSVHDKLKSGNYDYLINACDPDREGQLIFHSFYSAINCKLPVKRIWLLDLTDETITKALNSLKNDLTDTMLVNLTSASKLRACSDWLIGMNFTRAFSLMAGRTTVLGRVTTPTLKILADRELELMRFKPQNYWEIEGDFDKYNGLYYDHNNENETKFKTEAKANTFISKLGKEGIVESVLKKKETNYAPNLHSLSAIQNEASKEYGFTLDKTLNIVQSLYEKKLLSYPRTDCSFITTGEAQKFPQMLKVIEQIPDVSKYVSQILSDNKVITDTIKNKKYVNDKKVTAHYAIVPTGTPFNYSGLADDEKKIMLLVSKRLTSIFMPPIVSNKTTIITNVNNDKFKTIGSVLLDKGFSVVYGRNFVDNELPEIQKGDKVPLKGTKLIKKTTTPPPRYNDGTLNNAMENAGRFIEDEELKLVLKDSKGIGTPATRANIIEKLVKLDMVNRKGKSFFVTEFGLSLIASLNDHKITSPEMTGEWEEKLSKVENNELKAISFYNEMFKYVQLETNNMLKMKVDVEVDKKDIIGKCPSCGKIVKESKNYFMCVDYPDSCKMLVAKKLMGANITKTEAKKLLVGKTTKEFNFNNPKTKKKFTAALTFNKEKGQTEFVFSNPKK